MIDVEGVKQYFNEKGRCRSLTIFTLTPLEKRILIDEEAAGMGFPSKRKSSATRIKARTIDRARNGLKDRQSTSVTTRSGRKNEMDDFGR